MRAHTLIRRAPLCEIVRYTSYVLCTYRGVPRVHVRRCFGAAARARELVGGPERMHVHDSFTLA